MSNNIYVRNQAQYSLISYVDDYCKKEQSMSEENKTLDGRYHYALTHKHFWMCTFSVFLGVYLALSAFAFVHRPQFPPQMMMSPYMTQAPCMGICPCHQKMMIKKFLKQQKDFLEDARKMQEDN